MLLIIILLGIILIFFYYREIKKDDVKFNPTDYESTKPSSTNSEPFHPDQAKPYKRDYYADITQPDEIATMTLPKAIEAYNEYKKWSGHFLDFINQSLKDKEPWEETSRYIRDQNTFHQLCMLLRERITELSPDYFPAVIERDYISDPLRRDEIADMDIDQTIDAYKKYNSLRTRLSDQLSEGDSNLAVIDGVCTQLQQHIKDLNPFKSPRIKIS